MKAFPWCAPQDAAAAAGHGVLLVLTRVLDDAFALAVFNFGEGLEAGPTPRGGVRRGVAFLPVAVCGSQRSSAMPNDLISLPVGRGDAIKETAARMGRFPSSQLC